MAEKKCLSCVALNGGNQFFDVLVFEHAFHIRQRGFAVPLQQAFPGSQVATGFPVTEIPADVVAVGFLRVTRQKSHAACFASCLLGDFIGACL